MTNREKGFIFRYNSTWEKQKNNRYDEVSELPELDVEYVSKTVVDKEEYKRLVLDFRKHLEEEKSEDIVEIVKDIREYFKDLPDYKLKVQLVNSNQSEQVIFEKMMLINYCFCKREWDDILFISQYYGKINIEYKKEHIIIDDFDKVKAIYSEINTFLQRIIDLRNLYKEEELVMTKK